MRRTLFLWVLGCLPACGVDTGQERVSIPLYVAGTELSEPTMAQDDVPVVIDRADLAFGPLVLCAGSQAGDNCDTARLEWLDSVVIDATSDTPQRAGRLEGVTGSVRSWMYDLGISSQLTAQKPVVLDAARELGGVSLVLVGSAEVDGIELPFSAEIPVQQGEEAEVGIPVVRKSTDSVFRHEVEIDEAGLLVRFAAAPWVTGLDFSVYLDEVECSEGGPASTCQEQTEQTCAADGSVVETRDCAALEMVCVAGQGCVERVEIQRDSPAFRTLRLALESGARPEFEWGYTR